MHFRGGMNLNSTFVAETKRLFGEKRFERFVSALAAGPTVSVRYNSAKIPLPECADPVPWATGAEYLSERPRFTADPLFHAGCYYVQEASSMFLEQVVQQYVDAPVRALDLCAAPGGKSTHLLSILPEGSLLVANEPVPLRAQVLVENVTKWGNAAAVVTRNEPSDFAPFESFFDFLLVDAPCSGEGMFRKDAFAVEQWSEGNVKQCVERQRDILSKVWPALRPGGLLVYSTCTFNSKENEECVAWIADELGADVLPLSIPDDYGVTGNLAGSEYPVYRFIPGFTRGEGFFIAVLRKHGNMAIRQPRAPRVQLCPAKTKALVEGWIKSAADFDLLMQGDNLIATPKRDTNAIVALQQKLKVLHAALPVALLKNGKPQPCHALAMSTQIDTDTFTCIELEHDKAMMYLHRETLNFPDAPIGILLLTYKGVPIGFAKNVGNRANNLYPTEWRIRKNPMEL